MDLPHDHQAQDVQPAMPIEAVLLATMQQSERDVAAGLTTVLEDVLDELDSIVNEIETRRGV